MKKIFIIAITICFVAQLSYAQNFDREKSNAYNKRTKSLGPNPSKQHSQLYETIVKLDSIFFHAYNNCNLTAQAKFYSDSIKFFHDKTGLETSKKKILKDTKKYICGKVKRVLVKGSIEVSPISGYDAVEIGEHKFHNMKKNVTSKPSKFVILWRNNNGTWRITQVISLH